MNVKGYDVKAYADLRGADLQGADLRGADLQGAYLRGADLQGADLRGAYLRGADLQGADLRGADLQGADLRGAYLRGVYLRGAYLRGVYLRGAYLRGADLQGADLQEADLQGADLPHFQIVPEKGSFIAYKAFSYGVVGEVCIPEDAARTSTLVGRKCRVSKAMLTRFCNSELQTAFSWNRSDVYKVGTEMIPDRYDDDIRVECTHGIHIFLTKREAEAWANA